MALSIKYSSVKFGEEVLKLLNSSRWYTVTVLILCNEHLINKIPMLCNQTGR